MSPFHSPPNVPWEPHNDVRTVPSADEQLLLRATALMAPLAEAQAEMDAALDAGDVATVKAAGRRLMSLGWLFKEAGDKHSAGGL